MSMEISDAQVQVVKSFLKKRSGETHWVQFTEEAATVVATLIDVGTPEAIALGLATPVDQIERWVGERREFLQFLELIKEIQKQKGRSRYAHFPVQVREQTIAFLRYLSYSRLGQLTVIPKSTIADWKSSAKKFSDKSSAPTPAAESTAVARVITDSSEAKELSAMLERHKGKVRRRYSKSEKDLMLKLIDRFGPTVVHQHLKVSFDTLARLKRERERGHPQVHTKVKYAPVVATMKRYPGMGPMQIRDYVARHQGISMGVNSVRNVMEDNGWVASYTRKVVIDDESMRYEAVRRNYLWHLDFKHFYINQCKAYLLFIEDDFSRFIVGHAFAEAETVDEVTNALHRSMQSHGKPESLMSDGGSAFYSWRGISKFTAFLEDAGIDQIVSKVPRVNGKVESINQKFEKEVLNVHSFSSLKHFEEALIEWIGLYNFRRPHQGLSKLEVPADRFYPGSTRWLRENQKDPSELLLETLAKLVKELKKA